MAITPGAGYMVDPQNSNGVVPIPINPNQGTGGVSFAKPADPGIPAVTPYMQAMQEKAANQGKPGYDVLGNPVPKASEPAVLSSNSINELNANNVTKMGTLSQKGTTVGIDGKMYYSDGSLVPAPLGAEYNGSGWSAGGQTYAAPPQYLDNADNNPDIANANRIISSMKGSLDANTFQQIQSIEQQYDSLRSQQAEYNHQAEQSRAVSLQVGGTSRYAPLDAAGTTLAQATYGLKKIQEIDASENAALASAAAAHQQGDMNLMDKALTEVERLRQEKQQAAQTVATQLQAANQKMQDQVTQATRDNAIANLVQQGVSAPADILSLLNEHGGNYTAGEVDKVLKILTPDQSLSGLDADYRTFRQLQKDAPDTVQGMTYYDYLAAVANAKKTAAAGSGSGGGSGDGGGTALPPVTWQQFLDSWQAQNKADVQPGSSLWTDLQNQYSKLYSISTGKLTPTEKSNLERAGLSGAEGASQSYFLSTPAAFQDEFARKVASGAVTTADLDSLHAAYTEWSGSQQNSSSAKISALISALSSQ